MAFPSSCIMNGFKNSMLVKGQDFTATTGDQFKVSLHTNSATFTATATNFASLDAEVGDSGTYATPGFSIAKADNKTPANTGTTTYTGFGNTTPTSWTTFTGTARGCVVTNSTANVVVCAINFGGDKTATAGTFTITWPTNDASTGLLRFT